MTKNYFEINTFTKIYVLQVNLKMYGNFTYVNSILWVLTQKYIIQNIFSKTFEKSILVENFIRK